jgi:ATP-dependent Lon protease
MENQDLTRCHETVELPLLPLRDVVVYPQMVIPLFVGRDKSIKALEKAMAGDRRRIDQKAKHQGNSASIATLNITIILQAEPSQHPYFRASKQALFYQE